MKQVIKEPSKSELTKFLACLIAATQYAERGVNLFSGFRDAAKKMRGRLRSEPDFSGVMSHTRWTEIKVLVLLMMEGEMGTIRGGRCVDLLMASTKHARRNSPFSK